ncbi:MAG TPA: EF-P lysine aminoacylase EpmA [Steroidobacteraceae bacterium]|nr:EF-P lysine aminoacylase EpmA [Steroidobacteraceae bacterium]
MSWRPTASMPALRRRAAMLAAARGFFAERGVLEVETPILSAAAVTDPAIASLATRISGLEGARHLSTSPEYAMKRLLAAGSGDIYQISRAFRDGERGRWHNPEFTLIEWYRLGYDDAALMSEVESLVIALLAPERTLRPAERLSYAQALVRHAGVDLGSASDAELADAARRHDVACEASLDRDAALDLLMGLVVGPKLGREGPCFVCDYPASQAALARIKEGSSVAARFELYLDGIELANGFHELADAAEQRARFERDLTLRAAAGLPLPPIDERLLAALAAGMPDCAGVALGFDRLAAVALGTPGLAGAMAFTSDDA